MLLDEECKGCLYNSQLKKVAKEQGEDEKFEKFKLGVKALCNNPPATYCAPLLMRDIDRLHRKIYGHSIDYSREKRLFNGKLLEMEHTLFAEITSSPNPVLAAMQYAMAANYIDFARISDLDESAITVVMQAASRANPSERAMQSLIGDIKAAKTLCYLHDNCGEIVLDKLLIRTIKRLYPQIKVTSVVRGSPIINDVTVTDAAEVGLYDYAEVIDNGADIPGTYLKEINPQTKTHLKSDDIVIAKGLGNLETLYGEGYSVYYSFCCKCNHIAERFGAEYGSAVLVKEN